DTADTAVCATTEAQHDAVPEAGAPVRFLVPMRAKKAWRLSMNLGWFGVPPLGGSNGLGRLKPGLQAVRGQWSQCATKKACGLPMNRSAELQLGAAWRAPNAPTWRSALQARGSWSQRAPEL